MISYNSPQNDIVLIEGMAGRWKQFQEALEINIILYKEIIPHGVMADYAQLIWDEYENHGATRFVSEVLRFMGEAYSLSLVNKDYDLQSLIITSFIFNISNAEFKGASIISNMDIQLSEVASRYL